MLDICRFDSAVCESSEREQYQEMIKSDQIQLNEFIDCYLENVDGNVLNAKEEQCIEWLILRGIKVLSFGFVSKLGSIRFIY